MTFLHLKFQSWDVLDNNNPAPYLAKEQRLVFHLLDEVHYDLRALVPVLPSALGHLVAHVRPFDHHQNQH